MKKIIAANWKMNLESSDIAQFMEDIVPVANNTSAEIVIFPPSTYLSQVAKAAGSKILVGSQNHYWEKPGAFTGEISGAMLKEMGVEYVIIGHSERRQYFGETDATVNSRLKAALKAGLKPIVCVGETLAEREGGKTNDVIGRQLRDGLAGLTAADMANVPPWGTDS